jgi:peptidoglycan/xylan/chitin deacetylase (PgdA/CDA1 family)
MRPTLFLLFVSLAAAQFRTDDLQFTGAALPPKHLVVTFDDGIAGTVLSTGENQTLRISDYLHNLGIVGTFFQVGCHLDVPSTAGTDPLSSACMNGDTHPLSMERDLLDKGHIIGNHTWYHVPLTSIEQDGARVLKHVRLAQQVLEQFQPDGLRLFRAPGLAFDSAVAAILNADPYLARLTGPVGMDIDATAAINGMQFNGDAGWFAAGMSPEDCVEVYLQQVRDQCAAQGCILLIHDRTEKEIATDWAYRATVRLFERLGPGYTAVPPDAVPGILGNTRLGAARLWSAEFGVGDGEGVAVLGDPAGVKHAGACKVRPDLQIWCALADTSGGASPVLQRASPWLAIGDPEWLAGGHKFWLADFDGDGADDLIYATSQGFWVARSNGRSGFGQPQLRSAYFSAANGFDLRTLQDGARFGNFFGRGPGPKDLLVATPRGVLVSKNFSDNFGEPMLWSSYVAAPADLPTLQAADLNGDGLDDLVIRDLALGQLLVFTTHAGGFGGTSFNAGEPWMTFAGQANPNAWNDAHNGDSLRIARFGKKRTITAGATTGVVYSVVDSGKFNPGWRHLCNTCYTTLPDWNGDRRAAAIAWADLDGSGSDWAVFTRSTGLEIAPGLVQ